MRLTIPTAMKSYPCNHCTEPIHKGDLYFNIKLGTGRDYASSRMLQTSNYVTIRLHLSCVEKWARTRPRRKFNYKGRKPLVIKTMVRTPKGAYAFEEIETPLTPGQKKRRAVLITLFHRHRGRHDVVLLYDILVEVESLGGLPKRWLS